MNIFLQISRELNIEERQVAAVSKLIEDGGTVPFIARYRKEATGALDEVAILQIKELLQKYQDLKKRKISILKSLEDNGFLTEKLKKDVEKCDSMVVLEDIYLPYKPKRKTRGLKAKEAGYEPVAIEILKGNSVEASEEAIAGAKDIIAEIINEDSRVRDKLRREFIHVGEISSKVVKSKIDDAEKYKDYFKFNEPLKRVPSHRILAILRGVNEGFLKFSIDIDKNKALDVIERFYVKGQNRKLIIEAGEDSYKRLLHPSLETEMKNNYKKSADIKAIEVFQDNLESLLLAAPLGEKVVLAIDPGLRTGSKIAVLNKNGDLLDNKLIKPLPPHNQKDTSADVIKKLCSRYRVEAFSIGNGTGGREMEEFCNSINPGVPVIMTSEAGASVYSASECAREEFPDLDLTVRGAVSIGRRLMDPLAELVKIEPKSIGVGQYQHDVDQKLLKTSLEDTVVSCVNRVGVELNTASKELLSFTAGLNKKSAGNIVEYREQIGGFKSRSELLKVKGIGKKAYEQASGFLRVRNSKNPLDRSGVHPERYDLVKLMAKDIDAKLDDLVGNPVLVKSINIKKYISNDIGLPTLKDIIEELSKPGRDPREKFELFEFDNSIKEIADVVEGITVPGIVTNVTAFGAFVDIGVHQDGLVHISQLSDRFVKEPSDIVKTGDKVRVKVLEVDMKRKRISLTMKI